MIKIPLYQIDALTDKLFGGNPAAVCLLYEWLSTEVLQKIASENFLPETTFLVAIANNRYPIDFKYNQNQLKTCE